MAGHNIDYHVRDDAHCNTFGNTVHKGHCDNSDVAWDGFCKIIKVNLQDRGYQQETNDDQGRSRCKGRDGQENR